MKYHIFSKNTVSSQPGFIQATAIFNELCCFIDSDNIFTQLNQTHQHGASSTQIQSILQIKMEQLNFSSEKKGLFKNYNVSNLRPDFYCKLSESEGIIMEVERGKTIDNNMDLLDIWKCHICKESNYLFLIIPEFRQTGKGGQQNVFDRTLKRLSPFFQAPENYINVDAVFIAGY